MSTDIEEVKKTLDIIINQVNNNFEIAKGKFDRLRKNIDKAQENFDKIKKDLDKIDKNFEEIDRRSNRDTSRITFLLKFIAGKYPEFKAMFQENEKKRTAVNVLVNMNKIKM